MNPKWNHECPFWNQAEGDTTLKEMEAESGVLCFQDREPIESDSGGPKEQNTKN